MRCALKDYGTLPKARQPSIDSYLSRLAHREDEQSNQTMTSRALHLKCGL
jgi:hypothetical protein